MVLLDRPKMSGTSVTALSDIVIPPNSERVVSLLLDQSQNGKLLDEGEFCPDFVRLEELGLFTTGGVVKRQNRRIAVPFSNKTNFEKRVPAGTDLGVVDAIEGC